MLNIKFLVSMATKGHLKIGKLFLNGLRKSKRLFSGGNTLPYDRPEASFSLAHVQNFLCDEGALARFKPPKQKDAHTPSGNPLVHLFYRGRR
jgi:hypothetical protein